MTKEQIIEGNELIDSFMKEEESSKFGIVIYSSDLPKGFWDVCDPNELPYQRSWDWLMPAIQKFDRLYQNEVFVHYGIYQSYCDDIDNAVTEYEILPAFEALVSAITWYNKKHEFVYKSTFPPTVLNERALDENFFKNY